MKRPESRLAAHQVGPKEERATSKYRVACTYKKNVSKSFKRLRGTQYTHDSLRVLLEAVLVTHKHATSGIGGRPCRGKMLSLEWLRLSSNGFGHIGSPAHMRERCGEVAKNNPKQKQKQKHLKQKQFNALIV